MAPAADVTSSARLLFVGLVFRAGGGSGRFRGIFGGPNYSTLTTVEWDVFHAELGRAEAAGAVQLERDRQAQRSGTIGRVRLVDPDKLADFLGIERAVARARRALDSVPAPRSATARSVRDEMFQSWSR